ncbi:MAG: TlpA family protein disulfide reductase, partial [Allomuricauda sp.]
MKKTLSILTLLLIISCSNQKAEKDFAIISGKVMDSETKSVTLISINGEFSKDIPVNENGTFSDTLRSIPKMPYRLTDGINHIVMYLENGYHTQLHYDPKDFKSTIIFKGDGAPINRYYIEKQNTYSQVAGNNFEEFYAMNESDFIKKLDEMNMAIKNLIASTDSIPENIMEKEKRDVDYYTITLLGEYKDFAHAAVTQNPDFKVSENFPDERKKMSFVNQDDFDYSIMYKSLAHRHYRDKASELAKNDSIDNSDAFFKVVQEIPVEKIRNEIAYQTASRDIPYVEDLDGYYKKFIAISSNETHKSKITDSYNRLKKTVIGAPSPTFESYENHAGGHTSLSDLRGKYVYIDVWASWCAPCIKEIPALKEIEEAYQNKN